MRDAKLQDAPLSVLMLEDDALDIELVESRLSQTGYEFAIWKAGNKDDFLQLFSERHYDLILADYSLPDFDGLSALDIVREQDKEVPFIFVSGALGEEVAVETLHRGATDYVLKQRLERLVPAVSRALKEYLERLSRLQAESLLEESELRFQQMTNVLPALLWTTDREGNVTYWNDAWKTYTGDTLPASWCDRSVLHMDDISHGSRQWRDALRTQSPMECECRFRRADGSYRWHLVRVVPIRAGDSTSTWIGTSTDIEAQRQREETLRLSEKLVVIGRMAGAIAHEINNPLESLTNLLYLLRESDTSVDPGKTYLDEANEQLLRIASITRQTLSFYRDKASLGDIDCRSLIEESVALFRAKLRQKQIEVVLSTGSRVHFQALTGEIRQVLINLISNAIDAMQPGGVLTLSGSELSTPEGPEILIQVQDTGHGIPDDVRARLFEPFFSTKGSLGTGLGLWVTQSIVHRHRGAIDIESEPGRTTISVRLPANYRGEQTAA